MRSENPTSFFERNLILTEDGSHSIYVPELNEHYHSTHGAIQESNHVFIQAGLEEILRSKSNICVLEMGFGTGLNAFLTLVYGLGRPVDIQYTAIEPYPIVSEMVQALNYGKIIQEGDFEDYFKKLHSSSWGEWNTLHTYFDFMKLKTSLLAYQPTQKFDIVYFDAFAPNVQPELWTAEVFENIYGSMNPGGILVTYCCKGDVKRSMKSAGFSIEKLPGPPGKREMLRARKA